MLVTLLALALQAHVQEPPRLVVGEILEDEIADGDPVIHTATLDRSYTDTPVVGKSYRIQVNSAGMYTIELRSYFFDAYLVLRDEAGGVLAEDDDGAVGSHARITFELDPASVYLVEACALHGERGALELELRSGMPPTLSPKEKRAADRSDLERTVEAREKAFGSEHPATARSLNSLANLLYAQGDYAAARPYYERTLAIDEKTLGPEHPDTATSLNNLANLLWSQGEYAAARPYYERALAIREKALGPEHPDTAWSLSNLGSLLRVQYEYAAARPYFERALAIREKALGPEHPATATSLNNLGLLLGDQGEYAAARSHYERALTIYEKALGPEHADTAWSLNNLANLLYAQGEYSAARTCYERALAIREKALGPEHPETAASLNNLATLLWAQGEYAAARPYIERALTIREKVLGADHPDTAASLHDLGRLLHIQGEYAAARPYAERALATREKALGSEHRDTAWSLDSLAGLLEAQGEYAVARPYAERALAIREKALGPEHPITARSLSGLALLLQVQGDFAAARPLYERALAIFEKALGLEHPDTATGLNDLALLLHYQGEYVAARPLYERALAIYEKVLGPEHRNTATCLNKMGRLLYAQGEYAAARPLYERALAIYEKELGPEHPDTATCLNNLANLLYAQGEYAAARPYYERALAIRENALGPEHPITALAQSNLGILLADQGEEDARQHAFSALRARVKHAEKTLWSLSERERLSSLRQGEDALRLCLFLSIHDAGDRAKGYELALSWRGLVSRSLLASRSQLVASLPEGAATAMQNLRGVQAQLSKLLYATEISDQERHEREIRSLRERRNQLEVEVARLTGPAIERAPSLEELGRSLEPGSAFLDFLVHPLRRPAELEGERVVRKGEWSEEHLSAWIVRQGHELVHVDLGPAAPIEAEVKHWLPGVVSERGISTESPKSSTGEKLRSLLWEPLAAQLDGIDCVFVRADSFLGTLPLEVIPLEGGRYLIEEKGFVYVQTPNDLVRKEERSALSSLLALGGVDFQKRAGLQPAGEVAPVLASATLDDELRSSLNPFWSRLPHTENEAQTISDLFEARVPGSERLLLTLGAPTEERVKRELPRHSVVHLATHGFFHPAGTVSMWDSARESLGEESISTFDEETHHLVGELPGLLSGLVCAGANEPAPDGRDDGLFTAEEVLWLDLSKVELVVLSACETALGERRAGEGMIGLRRAFGLAGAKTVVSSLWPVKDRSTSDLMLSFYENLLTKHQGRAEALRNAQLEMLSRNRATEKDALPSTWGAFVLSGEWR